MRTILYALLLPLQLLTYVVALAWGVVLAAHVAELTLPLLGWL